MRLRPILMASMAFIMGVVPLALSTGAGAEMRSAKGIAVFAGMIRVRASVSSSRPSSTWSCGVWPVIVRSSSPASRRWRPPAYWPRPRELETEMGLIGAVLDEALPSKDRAEPIHRRCGVGCNGREYPSRQVLKAERG